MPDFYFTYHANGKLTPMVAEIAWTHNLVIMDKCKDELEREFYHRLLLVDGGSDNQERDSFGSRFS